MAEDFEAAAGKLLQAFLYVDVTRDSYIQMDELKPLMNSMGLDLDDNGIQEIINLFDDNGDGDGKGNGNGNSNSRVGPTRRAPPLSSCHLKRLTPTPSLHSAALPASRAPKPAGCRKWNC
mgnify:CR=1 FL=1